MRFCVYGSYAHGQGGGSFSASTCHRQNSITVDVTSSLIRCWFNVVCLSGNLNLLANKAIILQMILIHTISELNSQNYTVYIDYVQNQQGNGHQ